MNARLRLPAGIRWSPLLAVALLAAAAGAWTVLDHGSHLLGDAFRRSADPESVDVTTPLLAQFEETQGIYRRRFEGRSLFFAPSDWKAWLRSDCSSPWRFGFAVPKHSTGVHGGIIYRHKTPLKPASPQPSLRMQTLNRAHLISLTLWYRCRSGQWRVAHHPICQ